MTDNELALLRRYRDLAGEAWEAKADYDNLCAQMESIEREAYDILKREGPQEIYGLTLSAAVERTYKPENHEQAINDLREAGLEDHTRTQIVNWRTLNRRIKREGLFGKIKQSFGLYTQPVVRVTSND